MLQKPPNYGLFSGNLPEIERFDPSIRAFLYVKYTFKHFSTISIGIISHIFVQKSIFIWNNRYVLPKYSVKIGATFACARRETVV